MSFNAWMYVYANPLGFTDPSGMCIDMDFDGRCDFVIDPTSASSNPVVAPLGPLSPAAVLRHLWPGADCPDSANQTLDDAQVLVALNELRSYGLRPGISDKGVWTIDDVRTVLGSVVRVANSLHSVLDNLGPEGTRISIKGVFRAFFNGVSVLRGPSGKGRNGWLAQTSLDGWTITLWAPEEFWTTSPLRGMRLVAHELGHSMSATLGNRPAFWVQATTQHGWETIAKAPGECGYGPEAPPSDTQPEGPCYKWHKGLEFNAWSDPYDMFELWADVFANWAFGGLTGQKRGPFWREEMSRFMNELVAGKEYR